MLYLELLFFLIISISLSSVGLGGGAFYVPLLLAVGYTFPVSASTSLFLIMVTGLSAFTRFQKAQMVDWQLAVVMDTFTDLGAFVGGFTAVHFSGYYLKIAFGVLLIIASIFIFKMQSRKSLTQIQPQKRFGYWHRNAGEYSYSIYIPMIIPLTFAIGYLSGVLGIAGGLLKIPIMVLWFGVPAKIAVATSSLMVGLTGLLGFTGHIFTGKIDWVLCISVGFVVLVGGQIGSHFSIKMPEKTIKRYLAIVLSLIALWMVINGIITT